MSLLLLLQSDAAPPIEDIGRRYITAQLLDHTGAVVAGDPLANAFGITWFDERDGPGHGSLSLSLSEAGAAELLPGRYINCLVSTGSGGTPRVRFTFEIEGNPEYKIIQEGEEHDQIITVEGRGWGCVFDQTNIEPGANMTLRLDSSWRLFSFASPDFPNTAGWVAAQELYEYLDGVTYGYRYQQASDGLYYPAPIGWPFNTSLNIYDPDSPPGANYTETYWIWPPGEELSVGWAFFRNTFVAATDDVYTYAITGDNFFTLFLEGIPVLGENEEVHCWLGWKDEGTFLEAATYSIAAVVENPDWPLTNPGGFLQNVYKIGAGNLPETHVLSSDDSWQCLFVDAGGYWPGWTPGQILDTLISESVARGSLSVYDSHTFTDTVDSNGDAWRPSDPAFDSPYVPSFAVEVGSSIMETLNQMVAEGLGHWHAQPGSLVLDVWRAREGTPSSSATLAAGVNLRALERNATAAYANALLVQWVNGYIRVEDSAEIIARGDRIEDFYSTDATSEADAERLGLQELARRTQTGFPAIVVVVEPTSAADCPYEAYFVNDWVTVPAVGGGTEIVRVLSIAASHDDEGVVIWTLELNAKLSVPERRTNDLLRTIGGRNQIIRGTVQ